MQRLMEDVRDGKLDFALTKPEDSQVLVSVRDVRIWHAVDVISGGAVLASGSVQLDGRLSASGDVLLVRRAARCSGTMHDLLLLAGDRDARVLDRQRLEDRRSSSTASTRRAAGRSAIYPVWLRIGLTFIVPIAFAITVPAEAVTSRLGWETVAVAVGFSAALFAATRWWWGFGLRRYSGASA